jgi:pyruvate/2-oxoglutarate dehydrogenase complex dihydrolipoamide dehydrogenase (E3) component
MSVRYDLVVIGTGSAGRTIAHTCRAQEWAVAVGTRTHGSDIGYMF